MEPQTLFAEETILPERIRMLSWLLGKHVVLVTDIGLFCVAEGSIVLLGTSLLVAWVDSLRGKGCSSLFPSSGLLPSRGGANFMSVLECFALLSVPSK